MVIAIPYQDGQIFQHFGHSEQFKLYDVEGGHLLDTQIVSTEGSGHSALAEFLSALGVDAVVCGGVGGGAVAALARRGIALYGGVTGGADEAIDALLAGGLRYDPNAHCEEHDCGDDCEDEDCCGDCASCLH